MKCALKSAFFRFFKTGMLIWILVFSVVVGLGIAFDSSTYSITGSIISRPRYFDNDFLILSIIKVALVVPVGSAIFCTRFTGSDIAFRSINNKISTGISRRNIYFAELIVSTFAVVLTAAAEMIIIFLYAKIVPVKCFIKVNKEIVLLIVMAFVVCIAYTLVYLLLQYFMNTQLLGLILSLLMIPCIYFGTQYIGALLQEPYRYSYQDEQTGELKWEINKKYVSGSARKVYTFVYRSSPYYAIETYETDVKDTMITAGVVIVVSTAAGLLAVNKKEYS